MSDTVTKRRGRPRKHVFLYYMVSTDLRAGVQRRYMVTAEYNDRSEILYRAHHLADAQLCCARLDKNLPNGPKGGQ